MAGDALWAPLWPGYLLGYRQVGCKAHSRAGAWKFILIWCCVLRISAAPCIPPTVNFWARKNILIEQEMKRWTVMKQVTLTHEDIHRRAVTSSLFFFEEVTENPALVKSPVKVTFYRVFLVDLWHFKDRQDKYHYWEAVAKEEYSNLRIKALFYLCMKWIKDLFHLSSFFPLLSFSKHKALLKLSDSNYRFPNCRWWFTSYSTWGLCSKEMFGYNLCRNK